MNKLSFGLAALSAMALVTMDTSAAQAAHTYRGFGLHIGGRNVHLDIGNPHGRRSRSRVVYRTSRAYVPSHRTRYHYDWHDTSHWDYHPGEFVRHGNHYDYIPGHYDWHQEGHWDRHRGSHHRGHHRDHH